MDITWTYNGDQCELAILQMTLLAVESCDGWHLQEKVIQEFNVMMKNKKH